MKRQSLISRSKFGVRTDAIGKAARTFGGRVYDSQAEARYAAELDLKKKAGLIREIVPQVNVPLVVNGKKVCVHRIDFKVFMPDGSIEWHEVKGAVRDSWVIKKKLFDALFPDEVYRVIKV